MRPSRLVRRPAVGRKWSTTGTVQWKWCRRWGQIGRTTRTTALPITWCAKCSTALATSLIPVKARSAVFSFAYWLRNFVRIFRTVNQKSIEHPSIVCQKMSNRALSKSKLLYWYYRFVWFKSISSKRPTITFSHYCTSKILVLRCFLRYALYRQRNYEYKQGWISPDGRKAMSPICRYSNAV